MKKPADGPMTEHSIIDVELTTAGASPALLIARKANRKAAEGWRLLCVVVDPVRGRMCGFLVREVAEPPKDTE